LNGGETHDTNTGLYEPWGKYSGVPLSPGIPTGAEILYAASPDLKFSLGVFPVTSDVKYSESYSWSTVPTPASTDWSDTAVVNSPATYLPILFSVYYSHPLWWEGWETFVGFGLGVVPATSVTQTVTYTNVQGDNHPSNTSSQETLDAGFALRGVLGVDKAIAERYGVFSSFKVGLELQDLAFDQEIIQGQYTSGSTVMPGMGWSGQTADFNQWAPLLFVEGNF
ncbi:MAG: hypothetical protein ACREKE_06185, partial [bacterium]